MIKRIILILFTFIFFSNCSFDTKSGIWTGNEKIQKISSDKKKETILFKKEKLKIKELNSNYLIKTPLIVEKKNEIFQLFSENNFDTKNELWCDNLFSENELNEINSLKSTHIEKIEEKDKEIFFQNIINNIRLPNLIKEREHVKEKLLSNNDNSSKNLILRFQNLNNEINKIQNKKID